MESEFDAKGDTAVVRQLLPHSYYIRKAGKQLREIADRCAVYREEGPDFKFDGSGCRKPVENSIDEANDEDTMEKDNRAVRILPELREYRISISYSISRDIDCSFFDDVDLFVPSVRLFEDTLENWHVYPSNMFEDILESPSVCYDAGWPFVISYDVDIDWSSETGIEKQRQREIRENAQRKIGLRMIKRMLYEETLGVGKKLKGLYGRILDLEKPGNGHFFHSRKTNSLDRRTDHEEIKQRKLTYKTGQTSSNPFSSFLIISMLLTCVNGCQGVNQDQAGAEPWIEWNNIRNVVLTLQNPWMSMFHLFAICTLMIINKLCRKHVEIGDRGTSGDFNDIMEESKKVIRTLEVLQCVGVFVDWALQTTDIGMNPQINQVVQYCTWSCIIGLKVLSFALTSWIQVEMCVLDKPTLIRRNMLTYQQKLQLKNQESVPTAPENNEDQLFRKDVHAEIITECSPGKMYITCSLENDISMCKVIRSNAEPGLQISYSLFEKSAVQILYSKKRITQRSKPQFVLAPDYKIAYDMMTLNRLQDKGKTFNNGINKGLTPQPKDSRDDKENDKEKKRCTINNDTKAIEMHEDKETNNEENSIENNEMHEDKETDQEENSTENIEMHEDKETNNEENSIENNEMHGDKETDQEENSTENNEMHEDKETNIEENKFEGNQIKSELESSGEDYNSSSDEAEDLVSAEEVKREPKASFIVVRDGKTPGPWVSITEPNLPELSGSSRPISELDDHGCSRPISELDDHGCSRNTNRPVYSSEEEGQTMSTTINDSSTSHRDMENTGTVKIPTYTGKQLKQYLKGQKFKLKLVPSDKSDPRVDLHKGIFHDIPLKAVPKNMKKQPEAICGMREFEKLCNWRIAPQQLPAPKIEITLAHLTQVEKFEPILNIMTKIADGNAPGPQITMRYELLRICTLRNYPKDNKPYLTHLADAGFYYAAEGDEVICYCCGLRRHSWLGTDMPERIHRRINPNCKFLNRKDEFNVPVMFEGTTPNLQKIEALMARLNEETPIVAHAAESGNDVSEYPVSNPTATTTTTESSTALKNPKHPQYVLKSQRISSFQGWPDGVPQTPDVMADAGFYFAGFGDCVRCYYCGIGLRHWAEEDNPWIEHARWSQHCAFIKNVKGQEFINLVQMAVQYTQNAEENQASGTTENAEQQAEPPTQSEKEMVERILKGDPAQSVLDMGYQPKLIKKAIETILKKEGRQGISSQTIMEKVMELEEAETTQNVVNELATMDLNRHDNPSGGGASVASVDENSALAVKGEESKDKKKHQTNKSSGTVTNTIKQENKKLKEQTMCKICLENPVCIVFLPCGHLCSCDSCAGAMRTCPICRKEVKGTVKTYMT